MSCKFLKRDIVIRKYYKAVEEKTEQLTQSQMREKMEQGRLAREERNMRVAKKIKAMIENSIELAKKPVLGFRNQSSIILSSKTANISPRVMDSIVHRQLKLSMY